MPLLGGGGESTHLQGQQGTKARQEKGGGEGRGEKPILVLVCIGFCLVRLGSSSRTSQCHFWGGGKHAPAGTTGDRGKTGKGAGGRGGEKTLTGLSVPWLLLTPWLLAYSVPCLYVRIMGLRLLYALRLPSPKTHLSALLTAPATA